MNTISLCSNVIMSSVQRMFSWPFFSGLYCHSDNEAQQQQHSHQTSFTVCHYQSSYSLLMFFSFTKNHLCPYVNVDSILFSDVLKCLSYCTGRLRNSKFQPKSFGKTELCDNTRLGNLEFHAQTFDLLFTIKMLAFLQFTIKIRV